MTGKERPGDMCSAPLAKLFNQKKKSYISEMEKGINRSILFYTTRNTTSRVVEKNSHRK